MICIICGSYYGAGGFWGGGFKKTLAGFDLYFLPWGEN